MIGLLKNLSFEIILCDNMAQPRTRPRQEQATIEQMDRLHEQVMRQIPNLPDSERHALIRVYQQMWMRSESPQQAPRPRAPESGQLSGPLTDMVRLYEQEFNRIQGLPQGQRAAAMRDLMGRSQAMWDDAEHAQSAQPQVPRRVVTPAPRRVASYVYEIEMGGARYRVSLPERLPTAPNGRVNVAAARARLHDLLLTNQLVGPGGSISARMCRCSEPIRSRPLTTTKPRIHGSIGSGTGS